MNKRPTFNETVDVLVRAYLNDELEHKTCSACAVGNIVAAAIGTKPLRVLSQSAMMYDNNHFENGKAAWDGWYSHIKGRPTTEGRLQVEATGYTIKDLQQIEYAFENAPGEPKADEGLYPGKCTDPTWMFNGLMAVVDVLADIHGVDLSVKESAKLQFVKP